MKNNRLTNYLKLVLYFIKNSNFIKTHDTSDISDRYVIHYNSDQVSIQITKTVYGKYYSIKYNMSRVRIFDQCDFGMKNDVVHLAVKRFGTKNLEHSFIDLNLEDKFDYFNYTVQKDPGSLTLDDIPVLKEIRDLALKVLDNEKTI